MYIKKCMNTHITKLILSKKLNRSDIFDGVHRVINKSETLITGYSFQYNNYSYLDEFIKRWFYNNQSYL